MTNPVIESVRSSLGRDKRGVETLLSARPAIYPTRQVGSTESEIEQFLEEVRKLSGTALHLKDQSILEALTAFVRAENIRKATVWDEPKLKQIGVAEHLRTLGVELISPNADKHEMALCDVGITTADFLLPETGSLVLKSSAEKPRAVSLLPRIHLAIVRADMLRADLHQVFAEAKNSHYFVFITGPSRTADIELTVTLGVHGPKNLCVWMLED
jgi:L-lactate dehydrogenase complex protein LldG